MRSIFCAVLTLAMLVARMAAAEPVTLAGAEQQAMRSKAGLDYRIFIARPDGEPPEKGFPVIYMLDGNASFAMAWSIMRMQSNRPGGEGPTSAVIVAIGYPTDGPYDMARRAIDYTPAVTTPPAGGPTGGADAFLAFIEDELKPRIAAAHPVDPNRQALFGHSYGGLFTLHVLFTRPQAFQRYFAISPSIWWGDGAIKAEEAKAGPTDAPVTILVGEYEQKLRPTDTRPDRAARLAHTRMVDNARDMAGRLKARGMKVDFELLPDEDHGSIMAVAVAKALRSGF